MGFWATISHAGAREGGAPPQMLPVKPKMACQSLPPQSGPLKLSERSINPPQETQVTLWQAQPPDVSGKFYLLTPAGVTIKYYGPQPG